MSSILNVYGLAPVNSTHPATLYRDPFLINDLPKIVSDQLIGIEVEVEAAQAAIANLNKVWNMTTDGSLRNNGAEFVSKPIMASDAPITLKHLLSQYLQQDCCFSPRTSVHVALFQFAGRGRIKNIYCVPLVDTNLLLGLAGSDNVLRNWSKYTSLNLLPVREQGTVEFRHMHGTFDVTKLCNWIGLITKLKEYVIKTTTKNIRLMLHNMEVDASVQSLKREIFEEFADVLPDAETDIALAKGVIMSKDNMTQIYRGGITASNFNKFKG
jgi:predicted small secreted protein